MPLKGGEGILSLSLAPLRHQHHHQRREKRRTPCVVKDNGGWEKKQIKTKPSVTGAACFVDGHGHSVQVSNSFTCERGCLTGSLAQ